MHPIQILLLLAKALPGVLAVWIFMHLLIGEYRRAMEVREKIYRQVIADHLENERRQRAERFR